IFLPNFLLFCLHLGATDNNFTLRPVPIVQENQRKVRNVRLPLPLACLLLSFLLLPVVKAGSGTPHTKRGATHHIHTSSNSNSNTTEHFSQLLYDSLHLKKMGLSREALLYACKGQQKLSSKGKLDNPDILTVCDFSQSS